MTVRALRSGGARKQEAENRATWVRGIPDRGPADSLPARLARHPRLDEHLPVDHRLSRVYRIGAGLMGLVLLVFGILGLIGTVGFFDTEGDTVAGLNTNGALSVLSIVVGCVLFAGMVVGGNVASTLNMWLGVAFLLSGFVNLALLETDFNFLAFRLQNVLFSFVVGLMLMTFGMYGRVSGTLPHDNPYWRLRHPDQAAREEAAAHRARVGPPGGGQARYRPQRGLRRRPEQRAPQPPEARGGR